MFLDPDIDSVACEIYTNNGFHTTSPFRSPLPSILIPITVFFVRYTIDALSKFFLRPNNRAPSRSILLTIVPRVIYLYSILQALRALSLRNIKLVTPPGH